ncbi:Uma2 family endonuclease [Phormidium pseudopriestleyi FRX01]|uniref:Uma2 family endonuclease n=1 Tax=Phormidium pseudopriestleyi FRX01 TaxID=1759528 RepID=A0ABS3FRL3_9CYAN|nr:Uma2 family endonuclease [Phormidium pseudopriestleyi]MBO0349463.1 Uma2 family endonuclease [Phormidium pseudopriestleyi FRX01]
MVRISQNPTGEPLTTTPELGDVEDIPSLILPNIRWQTYEALLLDLKDTGRVRVAYDQGTLEIMTPSQEHESYSLSIHDCIVVLADELNLNLMNLGSTTLKKEDIQRGLEPDQCYYIQNEPRVRSKLKIDLSINPPPDLVIEVDITSGSLNKFPIYQSLKIPEIWRYRRRGLEIFELQSEEYLQRDFSPTFSPIAVTTAIPEFIQKSRSIGQIAALRALRTWVKEQLQNHE